MYDLTLGRDCSVKEGHIRCYVNFMAVRVQGAHACFLLGLVMDKHTVKIPFNIEFSEIFFAVFGM